jgi:hypothetical protein
MEILCNPCLNCDDTACECVVKVPTSLYVGGETSHPQAEEGLHVTGIELSLPKSCLCSRFWK